MSPHTSSLLTFPDQNYVEFLAYFPILEKQSSLMRSRCCLCVCVSVYPPIVVRQRLGKNLLIVSRQRLDKTPSIVTRQRLVRNVTAVTNTHATIEELLDASFSMWPVSFQRKVGE
jgi:hypothetical protein